MDLIFAFALNRDNQFEAAHFGDAEKFAIYEQKENQVNVIVSREFGKNIIMVNKHFIPVLISKEKPEKVVAILQDKLHWILDEWNSSGSDFKLFNIKSSILKLRIEE